VHSAAQARLIPNIRRLYKREGFEVEKPIAVFEAQAKQVTSFGSITRGVQVNQTPTILIVNKRGQTTTLTGLVDAYSIEQAIDEARNS
jgi:protein-disulfide isomerase